MSRWVEDTPLSLPIDSFTSRKAPVALGSDLLQAVWVGDLSAYCSVVGAPIPALTMNGKNVKLLQSCFRRSECSGNANIGHICYVLHSEVYFLMILFMSKRRLAGTRHSKLTVFAVYLSVWYLICALIG